MLQRLKGHRDVILEAGGENYYPAKGAAPISTLNAAVAHRYAGSNLEHPAASTPYNFDGTRCEYIPLRLQTSS
ncbi:MAG: hypothetical protein B7X50_10875 [Alishewanella sp. 34-51-39]|nr:MAG: hypothetical protein B7X50_10875 [Alishewanella sp. 34-51-39]